MTVWEKSILPLSLSFNGQIFTSEAHTFGKELPFWRVKSKILSLVTSLILSFVFLRRKVSMHRNINCPKEDIGIKSQNRVNLILKIQGTFCRATFQWFHCEITSKRLYRRETQVPLFSLLQLSSAPIETN